MTALIELNSVDLAYPIYSIRAQSLRNTIANIAVGGKLLKNDQDIIYVRALHNISFRLDDGDRLGLIGHNGAGKSTLLKVLAGVYEPDQGRVNVEGRISSMIDINLGTDYSLTGRENVVNMGRIRGFTTRQILEKMDEIITFSDLGRFIDLPMQTYSAGMTARLIFSVATSLEPDILLMDEWLGAGDQEFFEKASARMNDLLHRSRVIVLASHNHGLISSMCNKLLVLDAGVQIFFGDIADWDIVANRPMSETNAERARAAVVTEQPSPVATRSLTGAEAVEGKKGWLFLGKDSNDVMGQHKGDVVLSTSALRAWTKTLSARASRLKQQGLEYYFLAAPDNHAIYPEYLPDDVQPVAARPVHKILKTAERIENLHFIYPLDIMREKRNEFLMACTADTHWTHYGAYFAYRALMDQIKLKTPNVRVLELSDIRFQETDFMGDLGIKVVPHVTGKTVAAMPIGRKGKRVFKNSVVNGGHVQIFEQDDKSLASAVVFGDSYLMNLAHFFADTFSRFVMVHTPLVEFDYIEEEKPDVVISEMAERFLIRAPNDDKDMTSRQMMAQKTKSSPTAGA